MSLRPVTLAVVATLAAVSLFAACARSNTQSTAMTGDPKAGAALVQSSNCSGCHGGRFQGDLGPNLIGIEKRRTPVQIAGVITNPEPPMPKFDFSTQQVADVVAYLSQLDGGSGAGGGGVQPKISLSPAKPTDSAVVSVSFPGTPPPDATVETSMSMGHSRMGSDPIKLKKTADPHKLSAKVPFEMGGAWMIKVRYDKTHEVDMPVTVGQ